MRSRGLNQSALAKIAGVSRQAASLWLRDQRGPDVRIGHLENLSRALKLSIDDLVLPLAPEPEEALGLEADLLWDKIYPDLDGFLHALCRAEPKALARLVECCGLLASARMAGTSVWTGFPEYRRFLPPVLGHELEKIWSRRESLGWT